MTPNMLPLGGVIVDDADAERVGEWKPSAYSTNRFGDGYIHDDKAKKGEKKIIYRASLPENGVYEVRLSYNGDERYATNIPITVEGWARSITLRWINRRRPQSPGCFSQSVSSNLKKAAASMSSSKPPGPGTNT